MLKIEVNERELNELRKKMANLSVSIESLEREINTEAFLADDDGMDFIEKRIHFADLEIELMEMRQNETKTKISHGKRMKDLTLLRQDVQRIKNVLVS